MRPVLEYDYKLRPCACCCSQDAAPGSVTGLRAVQGVLTASGVQGLQALVRALPLSILEVHRGLSYDLGFAVEVYACACSAGMGDIGGAPARRRLLRP